MRIIAGEFRSRKLLSPPDAATTRPIPDRVKESVFALLRGHMEGATVFDAFAGSGAFGLEALSRGAARCVFIEKDKDAAALLKRNIETLGVEDRSELVIGDALGPGALARCPRPATIVFMDPPYPLVRELIGWKRMRVQFERLVSCLTDDGFGIFRTPWPFEQELPPEATPESIAAAEAAAEEDEKKRKKRGRDGKPVGKRGKGSGGRSERVRTGKLRDDEVEIWSIDRNAGESIESVTGDDLEREDDLEAEAAKAAAEKPKPVLVTPELSIPGAVGPETHLYGTMAVHFYQKLRG